MRALRRPTPFQATLLVVVLTVAFRVGPIRPNQDLRSSPRQVRVHRVLDGDTFETTDGERIRLLGIDAPEVAHHGQPGEKHGREARAALLQLIDGQPVRLQSGAEHQDRYGRTLAWVYDRNQRLINQHLLQHGHAKLLDRYGLPPNLEPQLRQAEASARIQRRGLWAAR